MTTQMTTIRICNNWHIFGMHFAHYSCRWSAHIYPLPDLFRKNEMETIELLYMYAWMTIIMHVHVYLNMMCLTCDWGSGVHTRGCTWTLLYANWYGEAFKPGHFRGTQYTVPDKCTLVNCWDRGNLRMFLPLWSSIYSCGHIRWHARFHMCLLSYIVPYIMQC